MEEKVSLNEDSNSPLQPPIEESNLIQKRFNKFKIPFIAALLVITTVALVSYPLFKNLRQRKNVENIKVHHVGILSALDYFSPAADGFKQKMTELGYIEGKNIIYDVQKAPAPVGNQEILKKFVQDRVDLIMVFPTEASLEAKEVTKDTGIPMIATCAFMEGNNLIESVRHPGANITGVRFPVTEVSVKRLEILHQMVPNAKRIWVPYLKDYPTALPSINAVTETAQSLNLTVTGVPFATPAELTEYLKAREAMKDNGIDAILLVVEPLGLTPAFLDQINDFANKHSIAVGGVSMTEADYGPIFSILPDSIVFGKLAAPLADKIFKGTPAGDIPVVTPESSLEINYRASKKLGLTVDDGLLTIARKIIR